MPTHWEPPQETRKQFAQRVTPILYAEAWSEAQRTGVQFQLGVDWDLVNQDTVKWAEERGAEMVGLQRVGERLVDNPESWWAIDATTREEINSLLSTAIEEGWSYQSLGREIQAAGIFEDWRADMIARTELALAQANGRIASLREAGVAEVLITDGDDDDTDEPCANANGEIWTLEEYEGNPLEHPNCVRSARPLTAAERGEREATADDDEEGD